MSRNGIFLYFMYMSSLLHAAAPNQLVKVNMKDPRKVQFAFDIHKTLTCQIKAVGTFFSNLPGLLKFFYLKTMHAAELKGYEDASVEGMIHAVQAIKNSDMASNAAKEYADVRNIIEPDMIDLLNNLAGQGYSLKVLSNIGPEMYGRIKGRYPQVFCETVVNDGIVVDYAQGEKPKPDQEPFMRFMQEHREHDPETGEPKVVIFVDDKQDNIDAANKAGMIGILFTTLPKFKADLADLGFDIEVDNAATTVYA